MRYALVFFGLLSSLGALGSWARAQTSGSEMSAASGKWVEITGSLHGMRTAANGSVNRLFLDGTDGGTEVLIPPPAEVDLSGIGIGQKLTVRGAAARLAGGTLVEAFALSGPTNRPLLHPRGRPSEPWALKDGRIRRPLLTTDGKIDGALLDDGSVIRFPSIPSVSKGAIASRRELQAAGRLVEGQLYAASICFPQIQLVYNSSRLALPRQAAGLLGPTITVSEGPQPIRPRTSGPALSPMKAIAVVEAVLRAPDGAITRLVLVDGTQVEITDEARLGLPADLSRGRKVSLVGQGIRYPGGTVIVAAWAQPVKANVFSR